MRSNGLTASSYEPVADLEPQVAAALLDDLRAQGVAAYTKPVESTTTSGFDRPEFRVGVKDRLFVDASASVRVSELIHDRDPSLAKGNDDLTWAQLVAGFDRPVDLAVAPWPVEEDLQVDEVVLDERDRASSEPVVDPAGEQPRMRWGSQVGSTDTTDDDFLISTSKSRPPADTDRFVPEPPPPLPSLPAYKQLAWIGLIGGPLILLLSAVASLSTPTWVSGLAVIGFVGGFVTLVATMGDNSDGDWGSGNGAVV